MRSFHIPSLEAQQLRREKSISSCKHISKTCISTILVSQWICVSSRKMLDVWLPHSSKSPCHENSVPLHSLSYVFELLLKDNSTRNLILSPIHDWDYRGKLRTRSNISVLEQISMR